jgi:hypothetical protein
MILTDPPSRARGLEQLLLTAADRPVAKLPLDDLQPLLDLVLVHAGAVAAQEELADVGRDRILPRKLPDQVLADDVPVEGVRGDLVEAIHFHSVSTSPSRAKPPGQRLDQN